MSDWQLHGADDAPVMIHGHDIEDAHARAVNAGFTQCPKCINGWLNYQIDNDQSLCVVCGYSATV